MAADATSRSGGTIRAFAPAKINLYLHVIGRRPDGYHLLDSLFAFVDIGDWVTATPADRLTLTIDGPEARDLAGTIDDNLIMRAARLLTETMPAAPRGAALHLTKNLPVSSGIGGGSSDAAAALRALFALWGHRPNPGSLSEIALKLGADTPACIAATPVWVGGIGEQLEPAPGLPTAGIVLANPRRALSTPAVFKARQGPFSDPCRFPLFEDAVGLAAVLRDCRNELTTPAVSLIPEIAEVIETLQRLPGALLARMSGSGATCFALFPDRAAAIAAHAALALSHSLWWSAAGALLAGEPEISTQ
jgi:4-diphosphocytidyl-2-C-methyl-D-erythritol kinase